MSRLAQPLSDNLDNMRLTFNSLKLDQPRGLYQTSVNQKTSEVTVPHLSPVPLLVDDTSLSSSSLPHPIHFDSVWFLCQSKFQGPICRFPRLAISSTSLGPQSWPCRNRVHELRLCDVRLHHPASNYIGGNKDVFIQFHA